MQQGPTIAVLMLCAITPEEHSTTSVNKGMRETNNCTGGVLFSSSPFLFKTEVMCPPGLKTAMLYVVQKYMARFPNKDKLNDIMWFGSSSFIVTCFSLGS